MVQKTLNSFIRPTLSGWIVPQLWTRKTALKSVISIATKHIIFDHVHQHQLCQPG